MYSMYFVFSYFICPVYCSIDTNACQYVRLRKLLLLSHDILMSYIPQDKIVGLNTKQYLFKRQRHKAML